MKKIIVAVGIAILSSMASANPVVNGLQAEDASRVCPAAPPSPETRVLRRDVAGILEAAGMVKDAVKVLIGDCGGYASAATTMNTIVISPALAELPRSERLFVLAHEVGHLANNDVQQWTALGEQFESAAFSDADVTNMMSSLSRKMEQDADAFSARALHKMEVNAENAATAFFSRMHLLKSAGTASHPAAQSRVVAIAATVAQMN
jgi:Zn-dependent protease with chaperone function